MWITIIIFLNHDKSYRLMSTMEQMGLLKLADLKQACGLPTRVKIPRWRVRVPASINIDVED